MEALNLQDLFRTNRSIFDGATQGLITALETNAVKQNVTTLRNRRLVTLAGQAELFDPTVSAIEGITDFEKGTPATQRYSNLIFAIDSFAVNGTTIDTDSGATGNQNVAVPSQLVPVQLLNADFNFQINQNVKYKAPASDFFVEGNRIEKVSSHDDYFVDLKHCPILILPNKPLQGVLRFNPSVTAPANNHFVEIAFRGVYIYE